MARAVVGRWGKNLAIRFPTDIAKAAGLGDGPWVEIVSARDAIVIRKVKTEETAESMFAGKSPWLCRRENGLRGFFPSVRRRRAP